MIKYGKPYADVLRHKSSFISRNDLELKRFAELFALYTQQPRREKCKNCDFFLSKAAFSKMGVEYVLCSKCGHLNGAHEDTEEFCKAIYTDDSGATYSKTYSSTSEKEYFNRVKDIYIPKAEFLKSSLEEINEKPKVLRYVDFGAGSGYFIAAMTRNGLHNIVGYDVSKAQVEFGNRMLGKNFLKQLELFEITDLIRKIEADVVSFIGVIEHVQFPRAIFKSIVENTKIKYIYMSVPLFSICVFFEMVFEHVMPRHLAPAHTHLYTESSLDYLCDEFGFERISEWWFGSDIVDLFRNIFVTLDKKNDESGELWSKMFKPLIDPLQVCQDTKKASSEVHMLLKVIR